MKKLSEYIFVLVLVFAFTAWAELSREELDQVAKEKFLKLHFFQDNRGMHVAPGLLSYLKKEGESISVGWFENFFRNRWGFNVVNKSLVGVFALPYYEKEIGVLGCVACHSGKAAGVFVPGLGNKNIDSVQIGKDAFKIQKLLAPKLSQGEYKEAAESAFAFAELLSQEDLGNLTQGLVPVSFIRAWFYKVAGQTMPKDSTRGAVKVPSLWGYGEKRKHGQFSDGFGNGVLPGWAIAVELTAGQTPETVRKYLPKIEEAEELFSHFLPPKYPFAINKDLANAGKKIFLSQCAGCHGTYEKDKEGLPLFKAPLWLPYEVVQTDFDRLQSNTPAFYKLVEENPLKDILQATNLGAGFFAPRLEGIWARFPYLHNGSVPTVWDLLKSPGQRPKYFSLKNSGDVERFDSTKLGLMDDESEFSLGIQCAAGRRNVYCTSRQGQSAQGHEFGLGLSDLEKYSVIEYLKTL